MKLAIGGVAVTLALPNRVSADVITHTQSLSIVRAFGQPYSSTLTFPQFDPANGTLTGVELTFSGSTAGQYSANPKSVGLARLVTTMGSDNPPLTSMTFSFSSQFQGLTGGQVSSTSDFSSVIQLTDPAGVVGQRLPFTPEQGTEYWFDVDTPQSLSFQTDIYSLVGSAAADAYFIGSGGTVTLFSVQSALFGPVTTDGPPVQATFASTTGDMTLAYTFTAVPEPSAIGLASAGLTLGAGAIRRSRKGRREALAQAV